MSKQGRSFTFQQVFLFIASHSEYYKLMKLELQQITNKKPQSKLWYLGFQNETLTLTSNIRTNCLKDHKKKKSLRYVYWNTAICSCFQYTNTVYIYYTYMYTYVLLVYWDMNVLPKYYCTDPIASLEWFLKQDYLIACSTVITAIEQTFCSGQFEK
jgi:hypothetical protein